jgi:hypothetical protein
MKINTKFLLFILLVGIVCSFIINGCGVTKQRITSLEKSYFVSGTVLGVSSANITTVGAYLGSNIYDTAQDFTVLLPLTNYRCNSGASFCVADYVLKVPAGSYQIIAFQDVVQPTGLSPGDYIGGNGVLLNVNSDVTSINFFMTVN